MPATNCGRKRLQILWIPFLWILSAAAVAQEGVAASQQHLQDANHALEAGDYESYTRSLEIAHQLNPDSLYTRYNLARGYARTGKTEQALAALDWLTRARIDFGMAEEPAFAAMADNPRFRQLVAQLEINTQPQVISREYLAIPRLDLLPEGIAWDAAGQRLFIGSMRNGDIYLLESGGGYSKFASVSQSTPLAAIGMTVDATRQLLWVIGAGFSLVDGFDPDKAVVSGVFGFDLASGELRHAHTRDDVGFGYNDVTLAPNGDLYLSGSELGYLPRGGDAIQSLATSEPVFGSNGIVVTADGKHLIASSYPAGISVIRIADGHTNFLRAPPHVALYGIDGMYLYNGDLIAVQYGAPPWRLMRFQVNDELTAITNAKVLEIANTRLWATTGAIVGNKIYLVGQGPVPESPPEHITADLHELLGETVVVTATLD